MDRCRASNSPCAGARSRARLLADPGDLLVVAGLGSTAWDVTAAGDRPLNFPLWGAMGGAAMIGLGLALAQPQRRVLVITGDGELLMGLGSLATIGVQRPPNLAIVVFDNERYGETGMQATHTRTASTSPRSPPPAAFQSPAPCARKPTSTPRCRSSDPPPARCSTSPRCAPSLSPSPCRRGTAPTSRTASATRCWAKMRLDPLNYCDRGGPEDRSPAMNA